MSPETPTELNGDKAPTPSSPGGSGGVLRRRRGSGDSNRRRSLRWSVDSGAADRDAYTAELLRAKTKRNLMRDVSRKKIRVQFAVPPPTLPETPESGGAADGNDEPTTHGVPMPLSAVVQYLSTRRLSDQSGDIGIDEEAHIPFGSRANVSAYDHSQHGTSRVEGRRTNIIDAQSADVLDLLQQLGDSCLSLDADNDGLHHGLDDDHHSGRIPFYAYPRQRQRWGEAQILPHINWGDLFFDLFYVAAAYNLGTLLMSTLTPSLYDRGIVYFIGVFGPLYNCWESKLVYESRYSVGDYAHQILEIIRVFLISISVLHIKSIELMADPKSAEMLGFTFGMFAESLIRIGLKIELICVGKGDTEAIRNHSKRKIKATYLPQSLFFLAAVILSAVQFWNETHPVEGEKRRLAAEYDSSYGSKAAASSSDAWSLADVPIVICLAAYVYHLLYHASKALVVPRMKDFRTGNVPSNIDFLIHRYGEWTMLMLGEAVLSLLIVDTTESSMYYIVAAMGVLTVILLQAVKFESEPSHAEGHALWRNLNWGVAYAMLVQLLSMGLIAFGVSYKVMLKSIHKESEKRAESSSDYVSGYGGESSEYDTGDEIGYGYDETKEASGDNYAEDYPDTRHRFLAPSVSTTDKASAALFSGSLAIILIALECMTNSHINTHDSLSHFLHPGEWLHEAGGKVKFALFLFKIGLIIFTATLSIWLTEPNHVAVAGFLVVAAFVMARIVWWNYIHYTFSGKEDKNGGKTQSRNSSNHGSIYAVDPKVSEAGDEKV